MKNILFIAILFRLHITTSFSQGAKEVNLTNNSADDRYASYSPTGKQIVFESNRDGNWGIYLMDANGKNQQKIVSTAFEDRRPSWHPNGKKVMFESNKSGKNELYTISIASNTIQRIDIPGIDGEPSFAQYSHDGKKIAFTLRKTDQESNIAVMDSNGKNVTLVTNYRFRSFYPNWSKDDTRLLFSSRHETNNKDDEIYNINLDGANKERLTNWPKHNFCPSWSKDGKKIAYVTSMKERRPEIYIMDADGKNQVRITYNNDGDTLPNWSVDNKKLLTTSYRNGNFEICELTIPHRKK